MLVSSSATFAREAPQQIRNPVVGLTDLVKIAREIWSRWQSVLSRINLGSLAMGGRRFPDRSATSTSPTLSRASGADEFEDDASHHARQPQCSHDRSQQH